jgi:hypothetical protein
MRLHLSGSGGSKIFATPWTSKPSPPQRGAMHRLSLPAKRYSRRQRRNCSTCTADCAASETSSYSIQFIATVCPATFRSSRGWKNAAGRARHSGCMGAISSACMSQPLSGSAVPRSTRSASSRSAAMATIQSYPRVSRHRRRFPASVLRQGKICGISLVPCRRVIGNSGRFFHRDPLCLSSIHTSLNNLCSGTRRLPGRRRSPKLCTTLNARSARHA